VGFETARALAWLGARVIVAEIDETTGQEAADLINAEIGSELASFVRVDVGDESSIRGLVAEVTQAFGPIDIVVNNATVTPLGPVPEVPLADWDLSYRVNLRGPVTFARLTVPDMRERGYGVFVCLSSVGGAYMAPYESLKAAQVELATSLAAELEDTGVFAFAIGPGQVMTPGLEAGVRVLAPLYGMDPEEFLALNSANLIGVEEAGAGIAAAVALAERFHGTEIGSVAGLTAAGIGHESEETPRSTVAAGDLAVAASLLARVRATLTEQVEGWASRGIFERKWMRTPPRSSILLPISTVGRFTSSSAWASSSASIAPMLSTGSRSS
jgi:NADP-dependent 3-hydroxy acid dehydrogenase YdfG